MQKFEFPSQGMCVYIDHSSEIGQYISVHIVHSLHIYMCVH
jgi:hypothetical protein